MVGDFIELERLLCHRNPLGIAVLDEACGCLQSSLSHSTYECHRQFATSCRFNTLCRFSSLLLLKKKLRHYSQWVDLRSIGKASHRLPWAVFCSRGSRAWQSYPKVMVAISWFAESPLFFYGIFIYFPSREWTIAKYPITSPRRHCNRLWQILNISPQRRGIKPSSWCAPVNIQNYFGNIWGYGLVTAALPTRNPRHGIQFRGLKTEICSDHRYEGWYYACLGTDQDTAVVRSYAANISSPSLIHCTSRLLRTPQPISSAFEEGRWREVHPWSWLCCIETEEISVTPFWRVVLETLHFLRK